MKAEHIYKGLSEPDRIRILNLLSEGPLCGCFMQEIMDMGQVKISKQLAYLRKLGLVTSAREANWVVYRLAGPIDPILVENLKIIRGQEAGDSELRLDLSKRQEMMTRVACNEKAAPEPVRKGCCCEK
ncbi:MAG: metalloregulator ArsR/SmtB family transcription factor [Opitutales bacterium]|jgi:ArsR family transcriptional regulator